MFSQNDLWKREARRKSNLRMSVIYYEAQQGRTVSAGSSIEPLVVAGNARVPVGIASLRVVLPCPDMQFVKRRQAVAIGGGNVIQQIPVQRRHAALGIV